MKNIGILIIIIVCFTSFIKAQSVEIISYKNATDLNLDTSKVSNFRGYYFDAKNDFKTIRNQSSLSFYFDTLLFELQETKILADDHLFIASNEKEIDTVEFINPITTYKGYVNNNKNNVARISISDEYLDGYFIINQEYYFIDNVKNLKSNAFVIYKGNDIKENFICENEEVINNYSSFNSINDKISQFSSSSPYLLDIALDADHFFYADNGSSVTNTINEMLSILNQVEGIYERDLNINFKVTYSHVWTSTAPYDYLNSNYFFRASIRDYWNNNRKNIFRDVVHLFSGRNDFGNHLGRSFPLTVGSNPCEAYCYSINTYAGTLVKIVGHEIGHTIGAPGDHSTATNCSSSTNASIMCEGIDNSGNAYFSNLSINAISSHINNNLAVFEGPLEIVGDLICTSGTTFSLQNSPSGSISWSSSSNISINSSSGYATTSHSQENGIITVIISNSLCNLELPKEVWLGSPDIGSVSINPGGFYTPLPSCIYDYDTRYSVEASQWPEGATSSSWSGDVSVIYEDAWYTASFYPLPNNPTYYGSGYLLFEASNSCGSTGVGIGYGPCYYSYSIYPNPSSDELNIAFLNTETEVDLQNTNKAVNIDIPVKINILDSNTEIVLSKEGTTGKNIKIITTSLVPGNYIVHIYINDSINKHHLVIN